MSYLSHLIIYFLITVPTQHVKIKKEKLGLQERVEGEFFFTQLEGKALCLLGSDTATVLD